MMLETLVRMFPLYSPNIKELVVIGKSKKSEVVLLADRPARFSRVGGNSVYNTKSFCRRILDSFSISVHVFQCTWYHLGTDVYFKNIQNHHHS